MHPHAQSGRLVADPTNREGPPTRCHRASLPRLLSHALGDRSVEPPELLFRLRLFAPAPDVLLDFLTLLDHAPARFLLTLLEILQSDLDQATDDGTTIRLAVGQSLVQFLKQRCGQ